MFNYAILKEHLKQSAFLNKGLKITLEDNRVDPIKKEEFKFDGGIKEYVEFLNRGKTTLHEVVYTEGTDSGIYTEIAFQYNEGYTSGIYSYCNNILMSAHPERTFFLCHSQKKGKTHPCLPACQQQTPLEAITAFSK